MKTQTIRIGGMTCGGCVNAVTRALKAVNGVRTVEVSLRPGQATVEFDESKTSAEQIRTAVVRAGYDVEPASAAHQGKGGCCA